jgi:hypothetical protein
MKGLPHCHTAEHVQIARGEYLDAAEESDEREQLIKVFHAGQIS